MPKNCQKNRIEPEKMDCNQAGASFFDPRTPNGEIWPFFNFIGDFRVSN